MLKVSGFGSNITFLNRAYGYGWGGHIAADWIAHNKNLFPIEYPHNLGHGLHGPGEALYDIYVCEIRGFIGPLQYEFPATWQMKFGPALIYKAMVNYQLINFHEDNLAWSDDDLKREALQESPTRQFIEERCGAWTAILLPWKLAIFLPCLSEGQPKYSLLGVE